jgi:uncharacterized membrane protein (UPF0127 family)
MIVPDQARARAREAVVCGPRDTIVCERCRVADTPLARMRGLLGRKGIGAEEGLLLRPAPSIHTFFMRFPIDAVFLDAHGRVLKVVEDLKPWRAAACRGAKAVLELAAGQARQRGIRLGDRLEERAFPSAASTGQRSVA